MIQNSETNTATHPVATTAQLLHAAVSFLRVVQYRKNVAIFCVGVALALGGLRFATATRYYESRAQLLVSSPADQTPESLAGGDLSQHRLMPTNESLVASPAVAEGAIKYLTPDDLADMQGAPESAWPNVIRENLRVSTVQATNILTIAYRSRDPEAAAAVVNAVVQSYLDFMDRNHRGSAADVLEVLTARQNMIAEELQQKEQALLAARKAFGDLGLNDHASALHPTTQRALSLNERLGSATQERLTAEASLTAIEGAIKRGEDLKQHALAIEAALGREFLLRGLGMSEYDERMRAAAENSLIQDERLLQHQFQSGLGPNHPDVLQTQSRIQQHRSYLDQYRSVSARRLDTLHRDELAPTLVRMASQRLEAAREQERVMAENFEQARQEALRTSGDQARLEMAEHEVRRLQGSHDALLSQIEKVDLTQDQGAIRTTPISNPVVSKVPVEPKLPLTLVTSLLCGLGIGLGAVYVMDTFDDRFRSPEELRARIGTQVLAMVRPLEIGEVTGAETLPTYCRAGSVESEAFRTLRTALAFADTECRRIAVSSAEPGDGKSTIIANLAVVYAQAGKRTLLIDADLRKPGLSSMLKMRGPGGLSETLRSDDGVAEAAQARIRPSGVPGLDVLACGPRPANPGEMLGHRRFSELLEWAEGEYEQVLVDCPPALAATDPAIIGRLVDGIVMVVRPDKNQRRIVLRAMDTFATLGVTVLGVVLNQVSTDANSNYYGYGSGYGYGYGQGYGYGEADDALEGDDEPLQVTEAQVPKRRGANEPTDDERDLIRRTAA